MFQSLPVAVLVLIFVAGAVAIWFAGIRLSNTTDVLSERLGLGEALGGLIVLAVVTNLPEIAITVSAALRGNLSLAVGNILGGVAVQTVVLVLLDVFGVGKATTLTRKAASLVLVVEAALVIAILSVVVLGSQLPPFTISRVTPSGLLIVLLWVAGLELVRRARSALPWHESGNGQAGQAEPRGHAKGKKNVRSKHQSTARVALVFFIAATVTLLAGVVLEGSGDALAQVLGMDGVLFGATILALATSLPEISTGLASVRLGDYQLAVSDIFGGNAFLPVLFFLATLVSGQAALPRVTPPDLYLTGLATLLTTVYLVGLIFQPKRQVARMGLDSLFVLVFYLLGVVGLFTLA